MSEGCKHLKVDYLNILLSV